MLNRVPRMGSVVLVAAILMGACPSTAVAAAGDLDATFGKGGRVVTEFPWGAAANAVAIQPGGRIVVAGEAGGGRWFGLARYEPDGTIDATFGTEGRVTTDFTDGLDWANAVAIQPDGRIVAVGHAGFRRFAVVRFDADGALDATFGSNGKVATNFRVGQDIARAVAIQPDGRIVVVGMASWDLGSAFALARYRTDGTLDPTFGRNGKVTTRFRGRTGNAYDVVIQSNGRLVVAGEGWPGFVLARYRRDGSLDPRFGRAGKATTRFRGRGEAHAVALQPDGKLVAAGLGGDIFGPFALARFTRRGRLDPTFGGNGRVRVDMGGGEESADAVAIQRKGKIVAVGYADVPHEIGDPGRGAFAVARFRSNGARDRSFGRDGKVLTRFAVGVALGQAVALHRGGRIVAAGWAGGRFGLARYLPR